MRMWLNVQRSTLIRNRRLLTLFTDAVLPVGSKKIRTEENKENKGF
jgi:hypothetical protein